MPPTVVDSPWLAAGIQTVDNVGEHHDDAAQQRSGGQASREAECGRDRDVKRDDRMRKGNIKKLGYHDHQEEDGRGCELAVVERFLNPAPRGDESRGRHEHQDRRVDTGSQRQFAHIR